MRRDESILLGQRLLTRALSDLAINPQQISKERYDRMLQEYSMDSEETLLEQIGLGNRMAPLVARALADVPLDSGSHDESGPLVIKGTEGTVVQFAKCCRPIPGDRILGLLTAGRGIVIHTQECRNVAEFRKSPEKWIEVQWEDGVKGEFPVDLRVEVSNQRGVLATVAAAVAETQANIDNISLDERDGKHTTLNLTVSVSGRRHLARIIKRLRHIPQVLRIQRK